MRLVLTHSGPHSAPKRQARYTPMPTTPPRLVISLLRAYPNGQDPTLRSGEKPHLLRYSMPTFFASLHPSTSSARLNPRTPRHSGAKPALVELWHSEHKGGSSPQGCSFALCPHVLKYMGEVDFQTHHLIELLHWYSDPWESFHRIT